MRIKKQEYWLWNMWIRIVILVFIFTLGAQKANSQWVIMSKEADSLTRLGADYIYNTEFDKAEQCFVKIQNMYPNLPVGYFLDAMVEWWRISVFRNTNIYDKKFLYKIDRVIAICDKQIEQKPNDLGALFFKGGALGYRGRYHVSKDSWISAAKDGASAYDLLIKCYELAPGNHDMMLGTGIYNYMAAVVPEKYPIVKPVLLFLPPGDKKIGLLQLKASANYARYAAIEAKFALLQIFSSSEFENNPWEALPIAEELANKYPNNPIFQRYLGRTYVKIGFYDKFEDTWRKVLIQCMDKRFGYDHITAREAMYYIGMALTFKRDYENALKYFYKCDEGSRSLDKDGPSAFMVMTNLWIGKIYDLQGKRNYAIMQYQKLLRWKEFNNSHSEARKYIANPYKG